MGRKVEKNLLSKIWRAFTLCICALTMSACGSPPAAVDPYQISITQEPPVLDSGGVGVSQAQSTSGMYQVVGAAGSVPFGSTVYVINMRNPETVINATPEPDGSFIAVIHAQIGDKLQITVVQGSLGSPPIYVYIGALNIKNPYTQDGNWYVGQVHFHTTNSRDAVNTPAEMEAAYHDAGYDFLISTDHRGTSPYVVHAEAGLTPDPDNASTGKDLLWIRGSELGDGAGHMGAWGHTVHTPISIASAAGLQTLIDTVRANGGITAMNHPANGIPPYGWDWNTEIKKTRGYSLVEAFNTGNGKELGETGFEHLPDAVDLADEFRQVWWIGADDCHNKDDPTQFNNWATVVQTPSSVISQKDILSSADSGNLYIRETATGPALIAVTVEGNTITVWMTDVASNYRVVWKKRGNEIVQTDLNINTSASYAVKGDEGYVRAEIQRIDDGKRAYTQPLFIANNVNLISSVTASNGTNAANLKDNSGSTYWEAGTSPSWFVVDVGSVRQVNAIRVDWHRADARRFNYRIDVSETGAFSGEQREVVRTTFDNRSASTLDFFDATTRYIKVSITSQSVGSGNSVRINEVQIFDSSPSRTQTYIDNVNGSDVNSGLAGSPWKTFLHARDHVRPRDTLNFLRTGTPYSGGLELNATQGGVNENASIIFQGDPVNLTEVDATGSTCGISLGGTQYVEWRHFDVHSATEANLCLWTVDAGTQIKYNKFRNSTKRGVLANGDFTLAYNLIYGNANDGALVRYDGTNARIYNNVFYGNGVHGLSLSDNSGLNVAVMNNISSGNAEAAFSRGSLGSVTDVHNCADGGYLGTWQQTNSIQSSVLFRNAAAGDFQLLSTSPCIDAGIDLNFYADFSGNAPVDDPLTQNRGSAGSYSRDYTDIGAFEYVP